MATWSIDSTDDCAGTNGDSFDGRSTTTGGRTWEDVLAGGCEVTGNRVEGVTVGNQINSARLTTAAGDNQRVNVTYTNNLLVGPMARVGAGGAGYFVGAASKFGAWTFYDVQDATTLNVIASGSNRGGTDGAEIRLDGTAYAVHIAGSGTADFSGTDGTHSTGTPGFGCWSNNISADNWNYYEDTDEGGGGLAIPIAARHYRTLRGE